MERLSPEIDPPNQVEKIGELYVRGVRAELRKSSAAADIPYLFNVIWWVNFRARTLDFSSTKAFQTLPSGISP
jgi:hypothetical protein